MAKKFARRGKSNVAPAHGPDTRPPIDVQAVVRLLNDVFGVQYAISNESDIPNPSCRYICWPDDSRYCVGITALAAVDEPNEDVRAVFAKWSTRLANGLSFDKEHVNMDFWTSPESDDVYRSRTETVAAILRCEPGLTVTLDDEDENFSLLVRGPMPRRYRSP